MTTSSPLHLLGISKTFGDTVALKPLTLEVQAGELIGLLGPSGCGKTTTLRIIAGFEMPDQGSVVIGSKDVTDLPPNHRGLGMVFQNYGLFPHMSVADNIGFGLKMRGVAGHERATRVREALETVRLGAYGDRSVRQLSGGQQQRVALARSLVTKPSILLLDEPLGALDKNLREEMQFELRELQRHSGITSILVTHDQEEALTMSDRVAVMTQGEVVQIGSPTEVYSRPRSRFVSEFLGTSNIFSGTISGNDVHQQVFSFDGQENAATDVGVGIDRKDGPRGLIAIRPENISLVPAGKGILNARLRDVVFRGSYYAFELDAPAASKPIFVYAQTPFEGEPGAAVGLRWEREAVVALRDTP